LVIYLRRKRKMANVIVKIALSSNGIHVTPDPFYISIKNNEQVVWECAGHQNHGTPGSPCFTVDFNDAGGSPFSDWHFQNHGASSGPATVHPDDKKLYKYTVSMHGRSIDPSGGVRQ
jgi:hypothetical protein